jgi:hypothetical protein
MHCYNHFIDTLATPGCPGPAIRWMGLGEPWPTYSVVAHIHPRWLGKSLAGFDAPARHQNEVVNIMKINKSHPANIGVNCRGLLTYVWMHGKACNSPCM